MTYETPADAPAGSTSDNGHRFRSTDRSRFAFFGTDGGLEAADVSEIMSPPALPPGILEEFDPMELMAGARVDAVFCHEGEEGLSLVRVNFAPHYMLPRHTHDADCLYYVISGSVVLGSRVVGPGAGFYVPAGAPYGYQAGPEGVELLEFRNATTFDIDVVEDNPARWRTMIDNARAHKEEWATF
jgi:quercetin dioxygenase-like cupin family protein